MDPTPAPASAAAPELAEETVCEALGRFEATLRAAVSEVHVDVSIFKRGMERRVEEACKASGPLAEAVATLQWENQQLKEQLEALTQLVKSLTGRQGEGSPSGEKDGADQGPVPVRSQALSQPQAPVQSGLLDPSEASEGSPSAQITISSASHPMADACTTKPGEYPFKRAPALKTPSPSLRRSISFPQSTETLPSISAIKSGFSPSLERSLDKSGSFSLSGGGDRRRELVRSQTLPRSNGTQAKRALFERLDSEPSKPKTQDSKPKLKRSQSFGVSSASGIKQILLEWCRSKTIGYQNIDIQNFSSSWCDGMAFCALVHSFFPLEFDYNTLDPAKRKHNFEVAFTTAEKQADCVRLIEVDDMMVMGNKPDPMCVFTYVQSLYNHLKIFE
ncbi:smoothelin-like protein 2 [Aplochiton taeniatus]